jgi:3-oxoacyl-[acyl-carrier protein] reductase
MDTELRGKVVLITGASGGIGAAIARAFAAEEARVVLHFNQGRARVESLRRELAGADPVVVRADLRQETEVRRLFTRVRSGLGRIDTLVANAGAWETRDVPLLAMSLRQWQQTMATVLTSAFLCLREFFSGRWRRNVEATPC